MQDRYALSRLQVQIFWLRIKKRKDQVAIFSDEVAKIRDEISPLFNSYRRAPGITLKLDAYIQARPHHNPGFTIHEFVVDVPANPIGANLAIIGFKLGNLNIKSRRNRQG